jgi:TPR repeat protein
MPASRRGRTNGYAAISLAAILLAPAASAFAAVRGPGVQVGRCQAIVRSALAQAPLMRRSDERIVRWLNGRHYKKADSALRSAARRYGDAWAGDTLGHQYAAGLGVPRDAATAFRWYLWAARRGDRFAQREVANAYLHGQGTKRDPAAAAYWFRIGIAPWQLAVIYHGLAQTYLRGHLAPVNRAKADYYLNESLAVLRQLATEPNGEAAYYLGLAYEHGDGVRRNRAEAMRYLCRAASLRYANAITEIHRLDSPNESP